MSATLLQKSPCWIIMQCRDKLCPARKSDDGRACWEMAQGLDDYRHEYNVCRDCLVYLLKSEMATFSEQELQLIREKKIECPLSTVGARG